MGLRPIALVEGEFYHVYNRGTDKRVLFNDFADTERFLKLMYISNTATPVNVRNILRKHPSPYGTQRGAPLVSIGAYCLMPNHFHLLITPCIEHGVSLFMKKLGTAYSMYFNKRYERTGTLFEGPFKAKWADDDIYLKYLFAYIHLNPIKLYSQSGVVGELTAGEALTFLTNYYGSSLADYVHAPRPETAIIDPEPFPDYFATSAAQLTELKEWLLYKEEIQARERQPQQWYQ